jgi:glyoxylase-like metal-dependent hydrolase (beta-lactamase superfamily II)
LSGQRGALLARCWVSLKKRRFQAANWLDKLGSSFANCPTTPAALGLAESTAAAKMNVRQMTGQLDRKGWRIEVLLEGSLRGASSVLISDGRRHIVVDTGLPHEEPELVRALERQGLKPLDIRIVINTHFHVDHVLNNRLFPQSVIYAPQESYDWARRLYADLRVEDDWEKLVLKYYPEVMAYEKAASYIGALRKFALRWWDEARLGEPSQFRWMETQILPEGIEAVFTSGHVPGHASLLVSNGRERTVVAGDALLSREHDDQILTMIPVDKEMYRRDREKILALGDRIVPGHDAEFQDLRTPPSDPETA